MKRYAAMVCLLTAMVVGRRAQCQYSDYYYHRVGDTVEWKANNGYYSWWELQPFFEEGFALQPKANFYYISKPVVGSLSLDHAFACGQEDSNIILQKFYTTTPLKVIGLAGCVNRSIMSSGNTYRGTDGVQEYLYLYDADSNAFTMKQQVPWSSLDSCRCLYFGWNSMHTMSWGAVPDSCCQHNPRESYLPLREYYFDSAIWVSDSFYVGASFFGNCFMRNWYSPGDVILNDSVRTSVYCADASYLGTPCDPDRQTLNTSSQCAIPGIKMMFKDERIDVLFGAPTQYAVPFEAEEWYWADNPWFSLLVYPIIQVDTTVPPADTCLPVGNVQVTVSGTTATVTWDDFPNYSRVLLRYGMCNQPVSQWTEEDVTGGTLHMLTGLTETACYSVRMKAECDTCKKETPWTDVVVFYTGQDTTGGTEGIDGEATALSTLTNVQPNPARDEVRVTSSFSLRRLELHDLSGVMVYSEPVFGHEKELDVSWLRAGTYIMTIATHDGTTHKRLQIVR